jgi:hypothetical protein
MRVCYASVGREEEDTSAALLCCAVLLAELSVESAPFKRMAGGEANGTRREQQRKKHTDSATEERQWPAVHRCVRLDHWV